MSYVNVKRLVGRIRSGRPVLSADYRRGHRDCWRQAGKTAWRRGVIYGLQMMKGDNRAYLNIAP
jgi:hypothetical protein